MESGTRRRIIESDEVRELLHHCGAVQQGHFAYASKRHGQTFIDCERLTRHPRVMQWLGRAIAEWFMSDEIGIVVGIAKGGIVLAQWVAHGLAEFGGAPSRRMQCASAIFAEREDGAFMFRHGWDEVVSGQRILVVDDVLNTSGSLWAVTELIRACCGKVCGVGVISNRGGIVACALGVPELFSLADIPLESWDAAICGLCAAGMPLITV